jgi:hypothetical protein
MDEAALAFYKVMPFLRKSDHVWLEDQADNFARFSASIFSDLNGETCYRTIKESEEALRALRKELFEKLFPRRWRS